MNRGNPITIWEQFNYNTIVNLCVDYIYNGCFSLSDYAIYF